jgi:Mg2+ and Co2+ transporter CorA
MRMLTVLTAVFLPLNLIAGIFGMNFEFIPLLHLTNGFWIAMALMLLVAVGLVVYFWRKRFIEHSGR